jgi:hypothetical protein
MLSISDLEFEEIRMSNMNPASTQRGQMLPPPRRPYRRITSQKWEEQKDHIHELFVEQQKTHMDVVRILKERHGFDVG